MKSQKLQGFACNVVISEKNTFDCVKTFDISTFTTTPHDKLKEKLHSLILGAFVTKRSDYTRKVGIRLFLQR